MYPNVEGSFGWTGLSLPATYLYKPWSTQRSKATSSLDTTSMLSITTLAPAWYQFGRLEHSLRSDDPVNKYLTVKSGT
ncbi:hypothetical protein EJB05_51734, partial [Eragrostis curvula]